MVNNTQKDKQSENKSKTILKKLELTTSSWLTITWGL